MEDLRNRIRVLSEVSRELEPTPSDRIRYQKLIQKFTEDFINNTDDRRAYTDEKVSPASLKLGKNGKKLGEILDLYQREVAEKGIQASSWSHLGYIPGGGLYASAMADFLAAITNEYAGIYFSSPGAVTIEEELLNWLKSLFSFPEEAVGNLTSGGSIATLIAFTAARDRHRIKGEKISKSVVYLSSQVHHCVNKALRIIGLEDIIIRHIELDENFRLKPEKLNEQINLDKNTGLNPFMIVASAGTTDTGAVDPLKRIGEIAGVNNLWYHADAAYGGFFILVDEKKELFKGIEMADSLVIDPHKGMFLPFGIGAVLVKDREAVFHSNHYVANYMQDSLLEDSLTNPADVSPELTRHFRGLRMWLPLQLHGIEPFAACLGEKLLLTDYFRRKLGESGFKVGPEPDLSVSFFWYPTNDIDENKFNERLMEMIHRDGRVFLSSTKINGKFLIRIAILSFRTKLHHIDRAIEMIIEAREKTEKSFS
jgi:glutamate/tyrosine decarboxylase-like PLP-dependent enzyme